MPASAKTSGTMRNLPATTAGDDLGIFLHPPHMDDGDFSTLFNTPANMVDNPSLAGFEGVGLKVFAVGKPQCREGSRELGGPSPSPLASAFGGTSSSDGSDASKQEFVLFMMTIVFQ